MKQISFSKIPLIKISTILLFCLLYVPQLLSKQTGSRQDYKIYVDDQGVMRRDDNNKEVSYYGTNYTLPFAHAYRALNYLDKDHKKAIDQDVYHFKRLGFNGFRLHLWDVELSDSLGNLISNEHLDLLDYLIAELEKNGIDIILTAQTNFGNGYPERNIDTGAFSYNFSKPEIHKNPDAIKIQENYISNLAKHVNPYTGLSYADDNAIIAIEINNEPFHNGTKQQVSDYINRMANILKQAGFEKPILYNVSHNPDVTAAYYDADIQGTTYQWYPTGLVAGHQRKGNFLPYVDNYEIPWKDSIPNFSKMAKVVYEFDPGDVLYSYLYPAIARTFRKEGFQWITQFAYDPTEIAKYNTEYQTHFLNLAYTPSKALSMLIAGEAARELPRGKSYGVFPNDTVFEDFTVSYNRDLSLFNNGEKYYHSNTTTEQPKDIKKLRHIAGKGNSPVIEYDGTGAYFLDETDIKGVWRLEVMPDVMIVEDPFEKPSLSKEIAKIVYRNQPIKINLPGFIDGYYYTRITNSEKNPIELNSNGSMKILPGVYLLSKNEGNLRKVVENELLDKSLGIFAAPEESFVSNVLMHQPLKYTDPETPLMITATVFGTEEPEKVAVYPSNVSFWREDNPIIKMQKTGPYTYSAEIPVEMLNWGDEFRYNIVVTDNGKDLTMPQNSMGNPLDWDFNTTSYYTTNYLRKGDPVILLQTSKENSGIESILLPEAWDFTVTPKLNSPVSEDFYSININPKEDGIFIINRYVGEELSGISSLKDKEYIFIKMDSSLANGDARIALTGKNGSSYSAVVEPKYVETPTVKLHEEKTPGPTVYKIPLADLKQDNTYILPATYPTFLKREIETGDQPFDVENIDFVELRINTHTGKTINGTLSGVWLE